MHTALIQVRVLQHQRITESVVPRGRVICEWTVIIVKIVRKGRHREKKGGLRARCKEFVKDNKNELG
jgi:hypothetical protein